MHTQFSTSRHWRLLAIMILVIASIGWSAAPPVPAAQAETAANSGAGLSYSADGRRYRFEAAAPGAAVTPQDIGRAAPHGSIPGPGNTAFWIEEEPLVWGDWEPEPQVWRIVQGQRDGSGGQTVLTSATFYAAHPRPDFNSAPIGLSLSANQTSIYFDPCKRTIVDIYCTAFSLDLQTLKTTNLNRDGWGRIAVAPDGQRAFVTYPHFCDMGGRYYHTYLTTPTTTVTLGTGLPGDVVWLANGQLIFGMVDDWTCDNQAETNRIRLAAANGTFIRDVALDVLPIELALSPDEQTVAYTTDVRNANYELVGKELWLIGMDGSGRRKIYDLPADASDLYWEAPSEARPQRPLVFIPGIMGSTLHKVMDQGIAEAPGWPGQPLLCSDHKELALDSAYSFVAIDAIRRAVASSNRLCTAGNLGYFDEDVYETFLKNLRSSDYLEYEVGLVPARRTLVGCDRTQTKANLFIYAYDWRQSNAKSATQLRDFMRCIRLLHPEADGVDIVAHSMGGLVARRFILDTHTLGEQARTELLPVKRLITVGTPWLGAPAAISIFESGVYPPFATAELWGNKGLMSTDELKTISRTFPGAHELVPSSTYYQRFPHLRFKEQGWDFDSDGNRDETYDFANQVIALNQRYQYEAGTNGSLFHSPSQDDWDAAAADIEYYHIIGIQPHRNTIRGLTASTQLKCRYWPLCAVTQTEYLFYNMGLGDGTVPEESARRRGAGAWYYEVREAEGDGVADHTAMLRNWEVINCVRSVLRGNPLCPQLAPNSTSLAQNTASPAADAFYIMVSGAASLAISDAAGRVSDTGGDMSALPPVVSTPSVPGVTIYRNGEDSFFLVLPASEPLSLTVRVGRAPLTIDAQFGDGEIIKQVVRYLDLALPAGTSAAMALDSQGISLLRHDQDGDGVSERELPPTATASGAQANDTEAPVITLTRSGSLNQSRITLDASDPAGVARFFYSLDGKTFLPYTEPFTLNVAEQTHVYAFADDLLGNRSYLHSFVLVTRQYLPIVNRGP